MVGIGSQVDFAPIADERIAVGETCVAAVCCNRARSAGTNAKCIGGRASLTASSAVLHARAKVNFTAV